MSHVNSDNCLLCKIMSTEVVKSGVKIMKGKKPNWVKGFEQLKKLKEKWKDEYDGESLDNETISFGGIEPDNGEEAIKILESDLNWFKKEIDKADKNEKSDFEKQEKGNFYNYVLYYSSSGSPSDEDMSIDKLNLSGILKSTNFIEI